MSRDYIEKIPDIEIQSVIYGNVGFSSIIDRLGSVTMKLDIKSRDKMVPSKTTSYGYGRWPRRKVTMITYLKFHSKGCRSDRLMFKHFGN